MISQKELKSYEFAVIYSYYDYIVESILVGQRNQAEQLVKKLSKAQKKDAILYMVEEYNLVMEDCANEAFNMIVEAL